MSSDCAIGIDIGGTQVRAALVKGGSVVRRAAACIDAEGGPAAAVQLVTELVARVRNADAKAEWNPSVAGVAAPGPLDTEKGVVIHIPTLPNWEGFPLKAELAEALHLPVVVENDGVAAAYGEWKFGAGRGLRHLVYVTVSTGIGGGVVIDGRLIHGRRGMAAHVGHFRMAQEAPRCSCGAIGCFEALASGTALGARARAAGRNEPASWLGRMSAHGPIDASIVTEGARAGDGLCLELLREEAQYLGMGFTGLIHLYSPERLVVGGGVASAFDLMKSDIEAVVARDTMPAFRDVVIVPADLAENSGLVGAAAIALDFSRSQLESNPCILIK